MKQTPFICSCNDSFQLFFPIGTPERSMLDGIAFILITAGEGIVKIDNHPYTLQPGTLISILPAHLLQWISKSSRFEYLCLAYEFDFMDDFPFMLHSCISEKMGSIPCIQLTTETEALLSGYHSTIKKHIPQTTHSSYQEILRSLIFVFVAEVCHVYNNEEKKNVTTQYKKSTDNFFHLLHIHVRTHRDVQFYAGNLCITSKHLAKIIRQVTGYSPSFWIANFTIKEAKALLRTSAITITQLSEELNFPNSSFFARYFRQHTGMSPLEYRDKK